MVREEDEEDDRHEETGREKVGISILYADDDTDNVSDSWLQLLNFEAKSNPWSTCSPPKQVQQSQLQTFNLQWKLSLSG